MSGGTGFVGRYIVEDLLAAGYAVTLGGRAPPAAGLFRRPVGFVPLALDPGRDQSDAFAGVDFFIHCAFSHVAGRYRGGEGDDPAGFRGLNVDGTVKLFETARRAGVHRCIFLSSRAVYGNITHGDRLTETAPPAPATLYGEVKRDAEYALFSLAAPGFATVSLRATGVYGELWPNKWDGLFSDYLAGRPVPARAGTEVHGRDVGRAVRLLMERDAEEIDRQPFNLSDILTDTREILGHLQRETGCPHSLPSPASNEVAELNTTKIRALGWQGGGHPLLEKTVRTLARSLPPQA
jgi:nucleoside-diphosphate-sugar epimerase